MQKKIAGIFFLILALQKIAGIFFLILALH